MTNDKNDLMILFNHYVQERAKLYDKDIKNAMARYNEMSAKITSIKEQIQVLENAKKG